MRNWDPEVAAYPQESSKEVAEPGFHSHLSGFKDRFLVSPALDFLKGMARKPRQKARSNRKSWQSSKQSANMRTHNLEGAERGGRGHAEESPLALQL